MSSVRGARPVAISSSSPSTVSPPSSTTVTGPVAPSRTTASTVTSVRICAPALAQRLGDQFPGERFHPGQQPRAPHQHGDAGAEGLPGRRHLCGDHRTADDQQPLRRLTGGGRLPAGPGAGPDDPGEGRDHGPGARRDHHGVAGGQDVVLALGAGDGDLADPVELGRGPGTRGRRWSRATRSGRRPSSCRSSSRGARTPPPRPGRPLRLRPGRAPCAHRPGPAPGAAVPCWGCRPSTSTPRPRARSPPAPWSARPPGSGPRCSRLPVPRRAPPRRIPPLQSCGQCRRGPGARAGNFRPPACRSRPGPCRSRPRPCPLPPVGPRRRAGPRRRSSPGPRPCPGRGPER